MPEIELEDGIKLRKKRPEKQLYIPPAQRRLHIKDRSVPQNKPGKGNNVKNESTVQEKSESEDINIPRLKSDEENSPAPVESLVNVFSTVFDFLCCSYFLRSRCTCEIYDDRILKFQPYYKKFKLKDYFTDFSDKYVISQIPVVRFHSSPVLLNILNIGLLQSPFDIGRSHNSKSYDVGTFPFYKIEKHIQYGNINLTGRVPLFNELETSYLKALKNFCIFCECDMYFINNTFLVENDLINFHNHQLHLENFQDSKEIEIFDNLKQIDNKLVVKPVTKSESDIIQDGMYLELKNVQKSVDSSTNDLTQNVLNKKPTVKKIGHEEEIEIMRKTKENINRKTRPIMKYVEDCNDTLNIEINNVKDWEELFNEDGEVREELLTKVETRVERNVKSVKGVGRYSEYGSEEIKQIEELEHMVELHAFPSSFKTQDLIQAFSDIDSDAMYIKWVDDTRAILVLGSSTQALKAIHLENPLIKVRPMSAASRDSLAVAYKHDLKPAMKRPPTNLQAARRFITAHLGTKIGVSKEKMAKERDDLKAARELKKLARKNERDAWDGNLRSSIN